MRIFFNALVQRRPFLLYKSEGDYAVYSRDELKEMGAAFDVAAHEAVLSGQSQEVRTEERDSRPSDVFDK